MHIEGPRNKRKILDQVRDCIRVKHYSYNTEKIYVYRIKEFILFHNLKHPKDMGANEIKQYLTWLAISRRVSASTQNQALNALVFLYKQILRKDLGDFSGALRAKKSNYVPTIISRKEISLLINNSRGVYRLMLTLLYGCGLRISELFDLRIQNIDIRGRQLRIYESKGNKSRTVMLPEASICLLKKQIAHCRKEWEEDRRLKYNGVETPHAIENKHRKAGESWNWFWLFPAFYQSRDPRSGIKRRHHLHKSTLQKHLKVIREKLQLTTRVTPHCFRHCFATHLLEDGCDINTVQRLLGHVKLQTTMMYLHALESRGARIPSPLDNFNINKKKPKKTPRIKRANQNRKKINIKQQVVVNNDRFSKSPNNQPQAITTYLKPETVLRN